MTTHFLAPTVKLAAIGLIAFPIPAYVLLGGEQVLENAGYDCLKAMQLVWYGAITGCLLLPIAFFSYLCHFNKQLTNRQIKNRLILFYLPLYICIPGVLEPCWSKASTLCNTSDGQNGIELLFSAWLALPILMFFGFLLELLFGIHRVNPELSRR